MKFTLFATSIFVSSRPEVPDVLPPNCGPFTVDSSLIV